MQISLMVVILACKSCSGVAFSRTAAMVRVRQTFVTCYKGG